MTLGEKKAKLQAVKWELFQSALLLGLFLASAIFTGILVGFRKGLMWANIADLAVSSCLCGMWLSECIAQLKAFTRLRKEVAEQNNNPPYNHE